MQFIRTGLRAAALIALVGAVVGVPAPASAAGPIINIRSALNNKCLEIRDSNVNNGAYVGMWNCWGGATTQWYWDGDLIRSNLNHKCLEVRDSNIENGAYVSMWDCWGGATTRWYW